MLRYLVAALLLAAATRVAFWAWGLATSRLRRPRFPWVSTTLLLGLAVGGAVPVIMHVRLERHLSDVATQLVGSRAVVRCKGLGAAFVDVDRNAGYVRVNRDGSMQRETVIDWETCRELTGYAGTGQGAPRREQAVAVHVLTHESMHMRGIGTEYAAECAAVQRDAWTARMLGADPGQARALARTFWLTTYPGMPPEYRSEDCRPGGSLDEGLPDPPWAPATR